MYKIYVQDSLGHIDYGLWRHKNALQSWQQVFLKDNNEKINQLILSDCDFIKKKNYETY